MSSFIHFIPIHRISFQFPSTFQQGYAYSSKTKKVLHLTCSCSYIGSAGQKEWKRGGGVLSNLNWTQTCKDPFEYIITKWPNRNEGFETLYNYWPPHSKTIGNDIGMDETRQSAATAHFIFPFSMSVWNEKFSSRIQSLNKQRRGRRECGWRLVAGGISYASQFGI